MPSTSQSSHDQSQIALNALSLPCAKEHITTPIANIEGKNKTFCDATPLSKNHMNVLDATCSAILSHALNAVLPVGTVEVKSVQHVLENLGNTKVKTSDNAISICSTTISPAKFINSKEFGELNPANKRLETYRIRTSFDELNKAFGSVQRFAQFITRSLDNCANQTAYAYVHQIGLGSVAPEDLSIDGKWLGLANAGVQSTTRDKPSDWQQEHADLSSIFIKWVCYYNSFNQTQINTDALIDFYNDKFNQYLEKYSVEFIGFDAATLSFADLRAEKRFLVKLIKSTYNKVSQTNPLVPLRQLLTTEISAFYCYDTHTASNANLSANARCQINETSQIQGDVSSKVQHSNLTTTDQSTRQARLIGTMREFYNLPFTAHAQSMVCAIKAFRKVVFADALSNSTLRAVITQKLETTGTQELESLTEKYRELACWLFNRIDSSVHVILFVNSFVKCFFVPVTHSFVYENYKTGARYSFLNLDELSKYISKQSKLDFHLPGVSGWQRLEQLIQLLLNVERVNTSQSKPEH